VEAQTSARLGEGPVWDAGREALLWVDIPNGRLHLFQDSEDDVIAELGEPLSAIAPTTDGGLVLAAASGLYVTDSYGRDGIGPLQRLCALPTDGGRRWPNDGACDGAGRLWLGVCGSDDDSDDGVLLRIERLGRVTTMMEGLTLPNGIAWSRNGRWMWLVESHRRTLYRYRFDMDSGTISDEIVVVCFPDTLGIPDGLAIDADDHIWIVFYGEGVLRRLTPDGQTISEVHLPTPEATSCCFGGSRLEMLYVTSGDWNRKGALNAGALFGFTPPVPGGSPVGRFDA
jgi:sugar lactone lactonase YvrE